LFRTSIIVLLAVTLLFTACSSGSKYPTNRPDSSYDLQAMSLAQEDLPAGYLQQDQRIFNNQDWAGVVGNPNADPASTQKKLDAEGRITGAATIYSWDNPSEHLGKPYQIATQSTLYKTAADASTALKQVCDLPIDQTNPLSDFKVSGLGDESTGFMSTSQVQGFGDSVDTAICFRTGRVIHAVVQSGLDGTQDVALDYRLAQKMLARVQDAFNGKTTGTRPPAGGSSPSSNGGSGSSSPTPAPAGSATPAPAGSPATGGTPKN